jgi:hypothetical protein
MPDGNVSTTQTDMKPHGRGALDRELFCPRLERLLLSSASELGYRGNLAQVVASIERGGAGVGGEDPNLSMLRRLGATDKRGIDNRVQQLRELEQRWRQLSTKHQATALAHYLGTIRAHATLRERFGAGQGGLAGVALYRWQVRQAKARERAGIATTLQADLEAVRGTLGPIEREAATLAALLEQPLPVLGPRPERPEAPDLVWRSAVLNRWFQPYWSKLRERAAPLRAARQRRREAAARLGELEPLLPPLRAEQARLCGALAAVAAQSGETDDELGLVKLCRSGSLDVAAHLTGAEADVRALHRAWGLTGKRAATDWVDEGDTAA